MGVNNTSPTYPKLKRPATKDFLKSRPRPWRIVEIHTDLDLAREVAEAKRAYGKVELELPKDAPPDDRRRALLAELKKRADELQEKLDGTSYQLLVGPAGRDTKERLLTEHPATDADHEAARAAARKQFLGMAAATVLDLATSDPKQAEATSRVLDAMSRTVDTQQAPYNADSYSAALIAASLIEPKLTVEELEEMTSEWSDGEWETLWTAVLEVNADSTMVSLGKSSSHGNGSRPTPA